MKYMHWNMRDINYGFPAIEHRYRVLGGNPVIIDDDKKLDLARLLIDIYGVGYAGHPFAPMTLVAILPSAPGACCRSPKEMDSAPRRP